MKLQRRQFLHLAAGPAIATALAARDCTNLYGCGPIALMVQIAAGGRAHGGARPALSDVPRQEFASQSQSARGFARSSSLLSGMRRICPRTSISSISSTAFFLISTELASHQARNGFLAALNIIGRLFQLADDIGTPIDSARSLAQKGLMLAHRGGTYKFEGVEQIVPTEGIELS